jgi:hypothetical protein
MNEQTLYAKHVKPWLEAVERAGAPLWWRKIHGSAFSRDMPDILFMINVAHLIHPSQLGYRSYGAVELKNPDDPKPPTPKQLRELRRIEKGGGDTLVSHDLDEVKHFFAACLEQAGWVHPTLTAPYL